MVDGYTFSRRGLGSFTVGQKTPNVLDADFSERQLVLPQKLAVSDSTSENLKNNKQQSGSAEFTEIPSETLKNYITFSDNNISEGGVNNLIALDTLLFKFLFKQSNPVKDLPLLEYLKEKKISIQKKISKKQLLKGAKAQPRRYFGVIDSILKNKKQQEDSLLKVTDFWSKKIIRRKTNADTKINYNNLLNNPRGAYSVEKQTNKSRKLHIEELARQKRKAKRRRLKRLKLKNQNPPEELLPKTPKVITKLTEFLKSTMPAKQSNLSLVADPTLEYGESKRIRFKNLKRTN